MKDCRFCKLANREISCNIVFENDHITAFLSKDPINPGHTLIVSKKHYLDVEEINDETLKSIFDASVLISKALKLNYKPDGISIMQNGGVFNDVGHYHMHVFPRYKGDGFGWEYPKLEEIEKTRLPEVREELIKAIKLVE